MKNLSNYINERLNIINNVISERLVLSKNGDRTLSKVKLKRNECIIRVSDFYCWYIGIDNFDDITKDIIDDTDLWFAQVENGSFENQYDVYDFIKDFVDDDDDYVVARQNDIGNCIDVEFELDGIHFGYDCTEFIPDDIIIRKK